MSSNWHLVWRFIATTGRHSGGGEVELVCGMRQAFEWVEVRFESFISSHVRALSRVLHMNMKHVNINLGAVKIAKFSNTQYKLVKLVVQCTWN